MPLLALVAGAVVMVLIGFCFFPSNALATPGGDGMYHADAPEWPRGVMRHVINSAHTQTDNN